jgi:hypothetical protein
MLKITFDHYGQTATAEIPTCLAPALRSAIQEQRNELAGRASGAHQYNREDAITRALDAIGALAAAINAVVPEEDADYA